MGVRSVGSISPVGTLSDRLKWNRCAPMLGASIAQSRQSDPNRISPNPSERVRKFPSHARNMIHAIVQIRHHERQGDRVVPSVHEPEHVHPHAHGFGRHQVSTWNGLPHHGHVISGQSVGPVSISFHEHMHQAIGEHHFPRFMRVIAHHADRSMTVRFVIGVKIPRGQLFSFFRQPLGQGFLDVIEQAVQ